ncbi:PQQ-like domain-containing protein [Micromonospora citrea]|uniref:PQQ-like domain-containing protein n=1 Tax=Micromonospora citrea TaxID=47855 RepID=A0A1C6U8I8_9ACTN|nr:PQQ-binding-like beta-propeller repeat protein [Micromonospora citrea]SCL50356.1 PQQ-like domain-containing protein [Micromonospora citrea]
MTLIDLGELRGGPDGAAPPSRPPRAAGRPLRVALVLASLVATMAGAAPARERVSVVVPARVGSQAFLDAGHVYVVEPAEGDPVGAAEVRAYALPEWAPTDGRKPAPLWRATVSASGRLWQVLSRGGVVLFSATGEQGFGETVALDLATGRERWRQPGHPWSDAAGTLLVQTADFVRSVDPASGRALWSAPTSPEGLHLDVRDGRVERVVLVAADGATQVRDPRSGDLLHAADLRPDGQPAFGQVVVTDGLLLLVRPRAGVLSAHGLDGLRPRWQVRLPPVDHVTECGGLLCVGTESEGFRVLDPASGAVRWTAQGWMGVLAGRAGRLLALGPGPAGERFVVLDAATGRQVADLGAWQLMPWRDADRLLAVRPAASGGGLVVGELDVAAGRARVVDVLRDASGECRGGTDAVLCRLRTGDLGVWRFGG